MSTYVIGDIQGCYNDFLNMLNEICFDSDEDYLLFTGNYIGIGQHNYEMIKWLSLNKSKKIILIKGNHEEEFMNDVDLIRKNPDYDILKQRYSNFDMHNIIHELINVYKYSFKDLLNLYNLFDSMMYLRNIHSNHVDYTVVHAGYTLNVNNLPYKNRKEYYLYCKDEDVYSNTTIKHRRLIFGHNPTIIKGSPSYNDGKVKIVYDKDKDNIFYNIDCGCAYKNKYPNAHLSCIRLEDTKIYYI